MDSQQLVLAAQRFSNRTRFRFEIDHSQILAMANRTPHPPGGQTGDRVILLDAPGAGFYWNIDAYVFWMDISNGAYANVDTNCKLGFAAGDLADSLNLPTFNTWYDSTPAPTINAMLVNPKKQVYFSSVVGFDFQATSQVVNGSTTNEVYAMLSNQSVHFFIDNAGTIMTGGNPLNRIVIELEAQRTQLAI